MMNSTIQIPLIPIRRTCDNSHKHCQEIIQTATKSTTQISQQYFNDFLTLVGSSRYSSCISQHYNSKHNDIKKFIISNSVKLKINNDGWSVLLSYMSDDEIYQLILNQQALEPNIISQLIGMDVVQTNGYGGRTNFLNMLITNISKIKSFTHLLMSMSLSEFSKYLDKMTKNFSSSIDNIIIIFIERNKDNFSGSNTHIGLKIINTFINKPNIIKNIYPLISKSINPEQKRVIFDKTISTLDKSLLLQMLENKDFVPDISTITKLVEKSYARPEGASNSKSVADIVDILCEYGLKIDKLIVLKLLSHGCYVNNFEKHGMVVDNEILAKCADLSYYPYKFDIIPNSDILKKECSKHDNLNTIKKLKEFGGTYTSECLEIACGLTKNGRVIKYLINECGVKISDKCLEEFQLAYRIDALDAIMNKYKIQNPVIKLDTDKQKNIEINEKSTMVVSPRNIKIDLKNDTIEYKLKNKIRKFFECKKKTIKYTELHEMVLRYLVTNKLVIGKYFVINIELSNLLKISHCVIMDTNQIHNILTYFIDLPEKNEKSTTDIYIITNN
jgi:hypothetical protein